MIRGLIVGKFLPPHRGHKFLIETARARCDELHVLVCAKPEHNPPGELRLQWLREIHPDCKIHLIDDRLDADDSRLWAEYSVRWLKCFPDVVFTSEDYGKTFARFLNCRHVEVDKARLAIPISGTRVRENPLAAWEFLEPPVRAHYALRACLVGAESTGKTTLAQNLAAHFQTVWVAEYGREYSERKLKHSARSSTGEPFYQWHSDEFAHIAAMQCARENALARDANKLLLLDTDAFATSIWHRRYFGFPSPQVEAIAASHRSPDLYFLMDCDTPFVQDGTRDGEAIRGWMQEEFLKELEKQNRPFVVLSGSFEERLQSAINSLAALLA